MKKKNNVFDYILPFVLPVLFLIFWQTTALRINNNAIIPTVDRVLENFINFFNDIIGIGTIPMNIGYSLMRVFLGYSFAALIALPLGLLMGYFRPVRALFENFINIFKPVPSISWQPIVLGWFGIMSLARITNLDYGPIFAKLDNFKFSMLSIIAIGSFFPIWLGTLDGVTGVRRVLIESAEVLGASKKNIFFDVLIPAAGPSIMSGLRAGLTSAWAALVAAEMLPGSMTGLGYMISHARELSRMDVVVTGIICIGFIGACFDGMFRLLINKKFSWGKDVR
ncbi:MAG: ABC transporter permease [Tissierellia bacterium]|nr:ABC transporter permease [Tissierellia bacterium]